MLPPLELHDPISHALEESYIASTCARCKLSLFLSFACMSQSRVCVCLIAAYSVAQHHDMSMDYMSCTCTHLCSVDTFKLGVCLSSLLYLSCYLVRTAVLFANHAFTNMGRPMRWQLHWKYHFTRSDTYNVILGVGVVFCFGLFACMIVFLLTSHVYLLLSYFLTRFTFSFTSSALLYCFFSSLHLQVSFA